MASKAELVKQLRAITFAGMTDCMKALNETNDNLELAIEWLRKNGAIKAAKKANAIAAEGLTIARLNDAHNEAVVIEINCQTDFVAKNEQFIKLANDIIQAIFLSGKTDDFSTLKINNESIDQACQNLTAIIGEKIALRRASVLKADQNQTLGVYTHMNNRVATAVLIDGNVSNEVATNVAMHIAAMNPKYVNESEVDSVWLNKEKEIIFEQTQQESNKPKEFLSKIVDGRINKLLKEICLISQPYVKEPSITIEQYLAKENAKVLKMVNYILGDGIEKKESDFASEVAEQMNQAK